MIAPPDRGSNLLRIGGYRGKRPCKDCRPGTIRIVTMGGSSTYGIPLHYGSRTFSAVLQTLLDSDRQESFEVLNGGIAGFGIWQVVEALENVVLKDRPDIVILNVWFNDSSYIPGWYGYKDLSDKQGYERVSRLRAIEGNAIYRLLCRSRLYAWLRYTLLSFNTAPDEVAPKRDGKKSKRKRRSDPKEFEQGIKRVLELAASYNFLPVLMLEPLNRTRPRAEAAKNNRYYQTLEILGAAYDIPILDTLTPFAEREGEWLFYDFIHPNEHGHSVIAVEIYRSFLSDAWHTKRSREFFKSKGIGLGK